MSGKKERKTQVRARCVWRASYVPFADQTRPFQPFLWVVFALYLFSLVSLRVATCAACCCPWAAPPCSLHGRYLFLARVARLNMLPACRRSLAAAPRLGECPRCRALFLLLPTRLSRLLLARARGAVRFAPRAPVFFRFFFRFFFFFFFCATRARARMLPWRRGPHWPPWPIKAACGLATVCELFCLGHLGRRRDRTLLVDKDAGAGARCWRGPPWTRGWRPVAEGTVLVKRHQVAQDGGIVWAPTVADRVCARRGSAAHHPPRP